MKSTYLAVMVAALALTCASCNRNEPAASNAAPAGSQTATTPTETPAPAPGQPPAAAPAQPPAAAQERPPVATEKPSAVSKAAPERRRTARNNAGPAGEEAPARGTVARNNAAPEAPAPRRVTVPEGTTLRVRTTSTISTKTAETGTAFVGSLAEPLVVGGTQIAPRGAQVRGKVVESDPGGRVRGVAHLAVELTSLEVGGSAVPISTASISQEAASTKKKDAAKVGIGAGIGAAIGAIAGGGKGAAIGAGAGAGAGTATVMATRGDAAVIPAETVLSFTLSAPVTVSK